MMMMNFERLGIRDDAYNRARSGTVHAQWLASTVEHLSRASPVSTRFKLHHLIGAEGFFATCGLCTALFECVVYVQTVLTIHGHPLCVARSSARGERFGCPRDVQSRVKQATQRQ